MGEMFLSAKHPFYQSTDIMSLEILAEGYFDAIVPFRDLLGL